MSTPCVQPQGVHGVQPQGVHVRAASGGPRARTSRTFLSHVHLAGGGGDERGGGGSVAGGGGLHI